MTLPAKKTRHPEKHKKNNVLKNQKNAKYQNVC